MKFYKQFVTYVFPKKVYVRGQEEYIWAMRTSDYQESDTDLWKVRRFTSPDFQYPSKEEKSKTVITDEQRTKVLASLVPDEIIFNFNDYSHRHYDACLLFGDVSGFTDLCEKYNRTGKSGPSRMTQVLNSYIGSMVQEVMSHNGDVLKFSGDAFLAMWKCTENDPMRDAVHQALDCALVIQKSHGMYETDVGVVIRVKLAISAGHVIFSLIGDVKNSHYVVVGQPIWDVKAAESKSIAGEIIVSPTAWMHVNPTEYLSEEMDDKLHVKVHGVGANWRNIQKSSRYQNNIEDDPDVDRDSQESDKSHEVEKDKTQDEFSLRPAVNIAARWKIKESLRRFILPPVMRGIDLDEPLEYLTEMRQVVIVFINVVSHKIEVSDCVNLADKTYKLVCNVVDDMKGCVNKVSLFDKDMMFVVIFGLRGFKHDLESQVALKCASECHQAISSFKEVKSTSIGVTTGMTYCGVFGHTLRREYTVISLIVNKAARLMVAYPYKVTCDRETFLHSKMQAKNFLLQEHKELKGITQPGPVYQFKEVAIPQGMAVSVSHFPLLGRDVELKLYTRLLDELIAISKLKKVTLSKLNHHNMIIIYGDARQGKTRLLDEMVFITNPKIPVNRFTLTNKDNKIPYETIRYFFMAPLGLRDTSTRTEWEESIVTRLGKLKAKDLFCCLNAVLGVQFDKTPLFLSLSDRQVKAVVQKFIKQLCYRCFLTNWVVAIDDGEFIDEESWSLLEMALDFDRIFIVMTMGQRRNLSLNAEHVLEHRRIRRITLKNIDKWFHAGLACQILDVYAIPPELEKVIQTRSNGNPGWVESYLVSLIQAGGLLVRKVNRKKVKDMGLVQPPLYMLFRLSREQVEDWKRIVEQTVGTHIDDWKMYIDCYKDESETNIYVSSEDIIPVCTLSPNFNVGDVDQELSMDVIILKTFDSLTSYEQLLLKSSSILGDCFPRDTLLYIMACTSKRQAALAVQKLFEIRVLSCARGDFLNEGTAMVFKARLVNPDHDIGIRCGCLGIILEEECEDLPQYASCGYLRFRSSLFRETTYSLLTEKQKKEFHSRAVTYLEKETRRCKACGYGFFPSFLGVKTDSGLQRSARKKRHGIRDEFGMTKSKSSAALRKESMMVQNAGSLQASAMMYSEGHLDLIPFNETNEMGYNTINKLKDSFSLTKTFSMYDFTECECLCILMTVYSQIIHHCKGSGNIDQMIDAMVEFANLCIMTDNTPQAKYTLKDAMVVVDQRPKDPDEAEWRVPVIKGRIYTLLGLAYEKLGQKQVGMRYLYDAMKHFGCPFPTTGFKMGYRKFLNDYKCKKILFMSKELIGSVKERYEADFAEHVSECLTHLCKHFIKTEQWMNAEIAAFWSLELSLKTGTDFRGICISFANMISVAQYNRNVTRCVALEVQSQRILHRKRQNVQIIELLAVAHLYYTIIYARFARGELDKAMYTGYVMLKICAQTHAVKLSLRLLPLLTHGLMQQKHVADAVTMIFELEYFAADDIDTSGLLWYYAACIELQLECGYTVIPYKHCVLFNSTKGENTPNLRDPDAERRYYTVLWLWSVRVENWEESDLWYKKAILFKQIKLKDSINNLITALYLLEGLILNLVSSVEKRNIKAVVLFHEEIKKLMKDLEAAAIHTPCIKPRLYHLIAYFKLIKYNDTRSFRLLKTAKKYAKKFSHFLECAWIEHSYKAWHHNLTSLAAGFWKERSQADNLMDYHEYDMNGGKLGFFTLVPPNYYR